MKTNFKCYWCKRDFYVGKRLKSQTTCPACHKTMVITLGDRGKGYQEFPENEQTMTRQSYINKRPFNLDLYTEITSLRLGKTYEECNPYLGNDKIDHSKMSDRNSTKYLVMNFVHKEFSKPEIDEINKNEKPLRVIKAKILDKFDDLENFTTYLKTNYRTV